MSKKKKSMIGLDPMAWINVDDDDQKTETKAEVKTETAAETVAEHKDKKPAVKAADPVAEPHPLGIVLEDFMAGFDLVKDNIDSVVHDFYQKLFTDYPDVKGLFTNTESAEQEKKLANAIGLLVRNINDVDKLTEVLTKLGERHQQYGAVKDHYAAVAKTLLAVLKQHGGKKWSKAMANNWEAVLTTAADVMLSAYTEEPESLPEVEGVIYLAEVQDIAGVAELHDNIKSGLEEDELKIDVSRVNRIDASSMQLLYSLLNNSEVSACKTSLIGSSEEFSKTAKLLGMDNVLKTA